MINNSRRVDLIGDDREVDLAVLQLLDLLDPLAVVRLGVDADRHDFDVARLELILEFGQHADLGGAYRVEVAREREITAKLGDRKVVDGRFVPGDVACVIVGGGHTAAAASTPPAVNNVVELNMPVVESHTKLGTSSPSCSTGTTIDSSTFLSVFLPLRRLMGSKARRPRGGPSGGGADYWTVSTRRSSKFESSPMLCALQACAVAVTSIRGPSSQ
eukprot:CAMPEP_0119477840 /NCGR_PEP_ID=MMETSP1344-20130328/7835_1 /TAXON_ID=236787 /ORGANISM="Florenciella parvula, Strain CCMP2471" /LENGTH=215 /DNA_ID=CAMNT_0007511929 /DNA_START=617 /DNA_END=1264 /DNA_ORIENTATION=+